jgi:hypothetical protein
MTGSAAMPVAVIDAFRHEANEMESVCKRRSLGHRRACNSWNTVNYLLGLPSTVLAAVAGTASFVAGHHVLAGVLALSAAVLSGLSTFLNPAQNARLHQHAAASYGALQGQFRRFSSIDLLLPGEDVAGLDAELNAAVSKFNEVDAASPPIPAWARGSWKALARRASRANPRAPA